MPKPVGTAIAEIDLDLNKFQQSLNRTKDMLLSTTQKSEEAFRVLGIKSDKTFDMMRTNATLAFNKISESGKFSMQEIARAQEAMTTKINALNKQQFGEHESHLTKLKANWLSASVAIAGSIAVMAKAWSMLKMSAGFEEQSNILDNLTKKYKTTSDSLIADMERASDFMIAKSDLMTIALGGIAKGLNPEQLIKLADAAKILGDAVGVSAKTALDDLTQALETGRTKGLKNYLGATLDLEAEFGELATKMNSAEKALALYNITILSANKLQAQQTGEVSKTADEIDKIEAKYKNLTLTIANYLKTVVVAAADALTTNNALMATKLTMEELDKLYKKGIIGLESYEKKKAQILGPSKDAVENKDAENKAIQAQNDLIKKQIKDREDAATAAKEGANTAKQALQDFAQASTKLEMLIAGNVSDQSKALAQIEQQYGQLKPALKGHTEELVKLEQWRADSIKALYAQEDKETAAHFVNMVKNYESGYQNLAQAIEEGEKITGDKLKKMGVKSESEQWSQNADDAIKEMERFVAVGEELGNQYRDRQKQANDTFFGGFKAGFADMVANQKTNAELGKEVWNDFADSVKRSMDIAVDQFIHADAEIAKSIKRENESLDSQYQKSLARLNKEASARSEADRVQMSDAEFVAKGKAKLDDQYFEGKQAIVDKEKELEKSKLTFQELIGGQMANLAGEISSKMYSAAIDKIISIIGALIGEAAGGAAASGSLKGGVVGALTEMGIFLGAGVAAMIGGKAMASSFKAEGGWVASHPMGGWINDGNGYQDDVFLGMTPGTRHWGMGGEFVVNKNSAAKHAGLLHSINSSHADGGPINDSWEPLADMFVIGTLASAAHGFYKGFIPGAIAEAIAFNVAAIGGAFGGKVLADAFKSGGGEIKNEGHGFFGDWINPFNNPITRAIGLPNPGDYVPGWLPEPGRAIESLDPEKLLEMIKQIVREPYKQIAKDLITPGINWSGPIDGISSSLKLLETVLKKSLGFKHSGGMIQSSADQLFIGQVGEGIVSRRGMDTLGMINSGHADGGFAGWPANSMRNIDWQATAFDLESPEGQAAHDLEMSARKLEIELIKAQGETTRALNMERWDELQTMDPTLRAMQKEVWAREDYNDYVEAYTENIAARREREKKLADSKHSMEIELMQAQGNATGALVAKRQDELKALDDSLKPIQEQIWAQEALNDAQEKAAKAQKAIQEEAARAQEEAARVQEAANAKALQISTQRRGMEITLMDAQGNAMGALAARREDELKALDPSLTALQKQIYAAQDATKAQEELTQAQTEAASKMKAIADQRHSMDIELMDAQGKAEEALAARRQDELDALDPSLRALKKQIWATQDLTKAQEEAASKLEAALGKIKAEDFATSYDFRKALGLTKVRGYASGGYHGGGWRMVGENGPELEWTQPSRIFSNGGSGNPLLGGGELVAEVRALREEMGQFGFQTVINTGRTAKILDRFDGEGLPAERDSNAITWG